MGSSAGCSCSAAVFGCGGEYLNSKFRQIESSERYGVLFFLNEKEEFPGKLNQSAKEVDSHPSMSSPGWEMPTNELLPPKKVV